MSKRVLFAAGMRESGQRDKALNIDAVAVCDKIMLAGIVVLFAGMPLAFGGLMTYDMFDLPKVVFMRIMSIIIVAAWGLKVLLRGEFTWRRTPLDIPVLAFAAANVLATIHTVSPSLSIFGEYRRYEGVITILNYLLLYFIAVDVVRSNKPEMMEDIARNDAGSGTSILPVEGGHCEAARDVQSLSIGELVRRIVRRIFFTSSGEGSSTRINLFDVLIATQIVAGAIVAFYGIAQTAGHDFVIYNPHGPSPIISTYGNRVFLAAYLIMAIPLGISLFLKSSWGAKIFIGSLVFIMSWALFLSEARGPWLGLLVALPVLAVLLGKRVLRRNLGWLALIALLIVVPAITNRDKIEGRLKDVFNNQHQTSVQFRFRWWQSMVPLITDNFALGVGVSGLEVVFPKYASVEFGSTEGRDTFLDKAHNEFIHIAATTGVVGLATYLWVLVAFGLVVWRRWKRRASNQTGGAAGWGHIAPLVAGVVAYIVQNQTSFGVIGISSLFWMMMGLVVALDNRPEEAKTIRLSLHLDKEPRAVLSIVLVLAAVFLGSYVFRLFQADQLYRVALGQVQEGQLDAALQTYKRILSLESHQSEYWRGMAEVYVDKARAADSQAGMASDGSKKEWVDAAIASFTKAAELNPSPFHYYFIGETYLLYDDQRGKMEAYQNLKKAVGLYPYYLYANKDLGQVAYQLQFYDDAIQAFQTVVQLDPNDADAYYNLALSYIHTGNEDQQVYAWQKLLALDPNNYEAHFYLGAVYEKRGRRDVAQREYQAVLSSQPPAGSESDYQQMKEKAEQALARLEENS